MYIVGKLPKRDVNKERRLKTNTMVLKNNNTNAVPFSMTLNNPKPRFQGQIIL